MSGQADQMLTVLVQQAARLLPETFPPSRFPGVQWEAASWDYTQAGVKKTRSSSLHFTAHPNDGRGKFHPQFEYALKAYLVHAMPGQSKACSVVAGARALWSALLATGLDPRCFRWNQVGQTVLDEVEQLMLNHLGVAESSSVIYGGALDNFLTWLKQEGILPVSLSFHRTLRLQNLRALSPEARKAREVRLVSREILEELANFYRTAKEPRERLLICAVGILMVAGFRVSELLTLPVDALQSEIVGGREKWYIRYWQRKAGKGKRLEENKRWLSPIGSELVRLLWKEILEITSDARAAARNLETCEAAGINVRIPWLAENAEYVLTADVERAFGLSSRQARVVTLARHGIQRVDPSVVGLTATRAVYCRRDVEAALQSLCPPLITYRSETRTQRLSETLLICFEQFMDPTKRTGEVLVSSLSRRAMPKFLDGSDPASLLAKHLKTRTHAFRHWLNTVANKAGMSVFLISVWMQRANVEQTLAYLHDPLDIAGLAQDGLREHRFSGRGAEAVYGLGPAEREEQINSIQLAHVAATVICTLDLTHAECPEEKFCEECPHGLHDPENRAMHKALRARLQALECNLMRLADLRTRGIPIHERQFEQAQNGITEIRRRLSSSLPVLSASATGA
jgi:hypothetical protein